MNSSRLIQLLEFLKEDPNDPFNLYAIAIEYRKSDPSKSLSYFEQLLHEHPDYLPTYYQIAHLYLDLNKRPEAEEALKAGITLAQQQANMLSLRELQNAYNELLYDEE